MGAILGRVNRSARPDSEARSLRVRHFVDGRPIHASSRRVFELKPHAVDHGRHGVPIASAEEVTGFVASCGDGLARWMAVGIDGRRAILYRVSAALRDHTFDLAEAYADDLGISAVETVAATTATIDAMLAFVDAAPASPLRPGVYVYRPSADHAGRGFVPLLWPLLLGGSTLILHPQLAKPRVGYAYATALSAVGLPDGVMNLVYGDHDTTLALLADPSVAGVLGIGPPQHTEALGAFADTFGKRRLTGLLVEAIGAEA